MSLFWRREIEWADEGGTHRYKIMVKDPLMNLVPKGGICPCNDKWYIVSVCPCPNCQRHRMYFLGSPISVNDEPVMIEYAGDPTQLYSLGISYHNPHDSATSPTEPPGKAKQWDTVVAPLQTVLLAVHHTTNETPYSNCGITADLYIDGVHKKQWNGSGYGQGEQIAIGDGIEGQSTYPTLEIDYKFESAGCHDVDLKITFSAIGHANVYYTCRQTVRVVDGGTEFVGFPWIGDIAIVPGAQGLFDFNCIVEGEYPMLGLRMGMYLNTLKGPFDSQADAAAVLAYFTGFIHAYAATCTCDTDCGSTAIQADGVSYYDGSWWLDRAAAGSDAGAYCATGWLRYSYGITYEPEGTTIQGLIIDPFGRETDAPESGILPPCSFLRFKITGVQGNEEFEESPIFGGADGAFSNDCVTGDEESEFYGRAWEYTPWDPNSPLVQPEGVPNSTADLNNYREYLGSLE